MLNKRKEFKMIKILSKVENNYPKNRMFLVVTLGYGEHCDDTYTHESIEIDDIKALDENLNRYSTNYITSDEAEKMHNFLNRIVEKSGDEHITLNDGIDDEWFKNEYNMTQKEINEFRKYYDEYRGLFIPRIDNWYGLVEAQIHYYDFNGNKYICKIV